MINELRRCLTRSDNVYFANNEQTSPAFTAAFCFALAEHNLIKLKVNKSVYIAKSELFVTCAKSRLKKIFNRGGNRFN